MSLTFYVAIQGAVFCVSVFRVKNSPAVVDPSSFKEFLLWPSFMKIEVTGPCQSFFVLKIKAKKKKSTDYVTRVFGS
jgi:hypothetical protein